MTDKKERTLVVIKPDGVQRSLIGEVIKRYERVGLKLVGIKMFVPEPDFIEKHYLLDPGWKESAGKKTLEAYKAKGLDHPAGDDPIKAANTIIETLKKYLSAGPVIAMVWEGINSVGVVRKITGGTEPLTSDVGTIRGDYTIDSYKLADVDGRSVRNLVHASGSPEEAKNEIDLWFNEKELLNYRLVQEAILYDVNLDGILE
ncbi:MAG: nucleoside-diphosphate kinase [Candidatus Colwellbacteria bacterium CG10_big_fil_rev_8_21_14_0_10_42_22]|uniref:nucleoside-diphosphate kinase n=1 Tax=Candidatus Colwellbacteria bacterium CG10_big_fil_rev_8_21_14_0_10_42_22 TaxID=1974540 RepID=A0A2H0VIE4_9BACT|nr:MAG: nucleoside-diphosphate kinase [Candidatus Colwellbacteria bacterium CG10_big_fil_rev_8_21_14_0_10_42_22]